MFLSDVGKVTQPKSKDVPLPVCQDEGDIATDEALPTPSPAPALRIKPKKIIQRPRQQPKETAPPLQQEPVPLELELELEDDKDNTSSKPATEPASPT